MACIKKYIQRYRYVILYLATIEIVAIPIIWRILSRLSHSHYEICYSCFGLAALLLNTILFFRAFVNSEQAIALAQENFGHSERRFGDFALASSDWLWESDAQHRYTYSSNELRNFGQDPEFRLGKTRHELAAESDRDPEKWRRHYAMLYRHEPFRDFVYTRRVNGGLEHIISVSGKPRFDQAGHFLGYRGTGRNITNEVLAERRLREAMAATERANAAKSQFLANMSHELRTPLNAIIGFSEVIATKMLGAVEAQYVEYAELIYQSGEHLLHIINQILDLSRVDAGKLELCEEPMSPRRVAESCIALLRGQAAAGTVSLSVAFDDPLPMLMADPTRLKEILLNLLSNAIKFTEPGGSVSLTVRHATNGSVEFQVNDTGIGMTESEIETALEPFGQVEGSLTRRHEGTGLGLPLAKQLIELHGGSLHIESRKGSGTTVTVALPATRVLADEDEPAQCSDTSFPAVRSPPDLPAIAD